jgi:CRP-like cAMP-binding protein
LACLPATAFRRAIHEHPQVCDQVLTILVGQIRMLANRARENAGLTVRHRLLAELLRLARPVASTPDAAAVSPPPTHAELAARISTHREAITRELSALSRAGLIGRRRGALVLLDAARLRQMLVQAEND